VPEDPDGATQCGSCGNPLLVGGPRTPAPGTLGRSAPEPLGLLPRTLFVFIGTGLAFAGGTLVSFFYGLSRGVVYGAEGWLSCLLISLAAVSFRMSRLSLIASFLALGGGISLILKPLVRPMWEEIGGRVTIYPTMAPSHLHFYAPGILLVLLGVWILYSMWKGRT